MQIKKQHLEVFFLALRGTENVLSLAESRIRDSFMKPLAEVTETYVNDRNKIYVAFCKKDEDGKPAWVDGNKYEFDNEKVEEINKELTTLAEEEVELTPPLFLKEMIEKTEWKPKVGEAALLDEVLTKL